MKFAYSIIYVADVAQTVDFYERAFGFQQKFITPENDYAELITGETTISFASHALAESNLKEGFKPIATEGLPVGVELAFTTEDILVDFDRAINAGATVVQAPVSKPWGQQVGYVRDCNGMLIEICTPMKSE